MYQKHPLKVAHVIKNTPETVVVTFQVPPHLKEAYRYEQGQHITLIKSIDGSEIRRSYSICSSVSEEALTVAIRKVEGGLFSTFANDQLVAGDELEVMTPSGKFNVDLNPTEQRTYVAFAAGSGITPIMSIIKTTLEIEPCARFMLFYGNRTGRSTLFREEIAQLKNRFIDRFSYWHFLSQEDLEIPFFQGRLDSQKIRGIFGRMVDISQVDHTFVCGPEAMIDAVIEVTAEAGVPSMLVHHEKFLSEGQKPAAPKRAMATEGLAKINLIMDGDEKSIRADHEVSILDAAVDGGLDAPFACKGGVCCTCRAKVLKGDVEMVLNQGLEPEEVAAGYVLTCQSFAVSEEVTLSFDE
ncbi:phenylacetate-CoA oxygenase/reductase subunit PaaK [Temperatibacter marinus]|uniref:Phenylacetate-CoA oxygenase/reductase subunit PaaK n=1 Tax=Temperatibacter marinus TaxID=1456591 RepID=A0AA52EGA3_9PROT|nr:1,2-phenylacetyl-CoA epoxidase subunit PaaE [Temperatibacter marinus]WND01541.1 phenylacetate-CoA oxygenase/reductase subunit PaaK [Temperatibacter marinus]